MLAMVDYSSGSNCILVNTKDGAIDNFVKFHEHFRRQFGVRVKCVHSNPGGELVNYIIKEFLQLHGILHHTTKKTLPFKMAKSRAFTARYIMQPENGLVIWYAGKILGHYSTPALCAIISIRGNADRRSFLVVFMDNTPDVSHLIRFSTCCIVKLQHAVAKSLQKCFEKKFILEIDAVSNGYNLYLPRPIVFPTRFNIQNIVRVDSDASGDIFNTFDSLDAVPSPIQTQTL